MKKLIWILAATVVLGLSNAALAGNIRNLSGQSCGDLIGTWHFVNNQTGGAPAGTLQAYWSSGDSCTVGPSNANLQSTQHFNCVASGTLVSASTNLPGRLVLSDFSCATKCTKGCEPPK